MKQLEIGDTIDDMWGLYDKLKMQMSIDVGLIRNVRVRLMWSVVNVVKTTRLMTHGQLN